MSTTPLRILVADRDPETRASLYGPLEGAGYRVATLEPDAKALEHVARYRPGLVLSDARPGDPEDAAFLAALRRISPGSRVVLLGAGTGAPSDGRLPKPVPTEALLGLVRRMLPREEAVA